MIRSYKFSLLNVASIGLVLFMIYILLSNPKQAGGGDGLSNFFPVVGIIFGGIGLLIDMILKKTIKNRMTQNIIGFFIILTALGSIVYILKN